MAAWTWWSDQDCGCFGAQTPKGVPLLLDVIAIALILWSLKTESNRRDGWNRAHMALRSSIATGLLGALISSGFVAGRVQRLQSAARMPQWLGENLIGTELPLLKDERFTPQVPASGDVLLVLLRPDCSHCQEFAEKWLDLRQTMPPSLTVIGISVSPNEWTVMPGIVSADAVTTPNGFVLHWNNDEPFVAAPALLAVHDRIVHNIGGDEQANALGEGLVTFAGLFRTVPISDGSATE